MASEKTVLVSGATGRQGGAVARHLLNNGWGVRALTRDPQKPPARELAALGADVVQGDLTNRASIEKAAQGVYGVFSVQNFWETGVQGEVREGKLLADVAKAAHVSHFVYSSVGGADRDTGIPHFDSKWEIERHIRSRDLPATILRPVFFMENFISDDFRSSILKGKLALPMQPGKPLQMIAVDDIGAFAAMAFSAPESFQDAELELAGDELTLPQAAEDLSRILGRTVDFISVPLEDVRKASPEYEMMFRWFNEYGYSADIEAMRDLYPELTTFPMWLHRTGWSRLGKEAA